MDEQQWLISEDPAAMLGHLQQHAKVSDRKLRLFAVACCQQVWHLLTDERSRRAVEVAFHYADGGTTEEERRLLYLETHEAYERFRPHYPPDMETMPNGRAVNAFAAAVNCLFHEINPGLVLHQTKEAGLSPATQAAILRDIVGNPWRPVELDMVRRWYPVSSPVEFYEECPWLTPTVLALAMACYVERAVCGRCQGKWRTVDGYSTCQVQDGNSPVRWKRCPDCHGTGHDGSGHLHADRLAVLADALEESGCDDADILGHLRGPGPHVRGCWAVDLLTGRC